VFALAIMRVDGIAGNVQSSFKWTIRGRSWALALVFARLAGPVLFKAMGFAERGTPIQADSSPEGLNNDAEFKSVPLASPFSYVSRKAMSCNLAVRTGPARHGTFLQAGS